MNVETVYTVTIAAILVGTGLRAANIFISAGRAIVIKHDDSVSEFAISVSEFAIRLAGIGVGIALAFTLWPYGLDDPSQTVEDVTKSGYTVPDVPLVPSPAARDTYVPEEAAAADAAVWDASPTIATIGSFLRLPRVPHFGPICR